MRALKKLFHDNKGKTLLAIFPHPDDESFVAGGFIQEAIKSGIKVKIVSLTNGAFDEVGNRETEFKTAVGILGTTDFEIWKYKEGQLADFEKEWGKKIEKIIVSTKPFAVLTFDPNGITAHPDHIISSVSILNIIKSLKIEKPKLLWRISDTSEKKHFNQGKGLLVDKEPTYLFNLSLARSINKLKAIFTYKSQFKSVLFKLRVFDWYLLDHKEQYYSVHLEKDKFNLLFDKE